MCVSELEVDRPHYMIWPFGNDYIGSLYLSDPFGSFQSDFGVSFLRNFLLEKDRFADNRLNRCHEKVCCSPN